MRLWPQKSEREAETERGILAGVAINMPLSEARAAYYATERGREMLNLSRAATIDDQVARILYDRAYADLRVQLRLDEGAI
jgi:hypothetical protein